MRRTAIAVLVAFGLVTSCNTTGSAPLPDIVIASDMPMTGFPASYWLSLTRAVQLAIAEHPLIGRFRLGYEPLDDSLASFSSPVKGAQNVKRMIADPRVMGMVGPTATSDAFEEIPVANGGGLAMISPANTNWCLTRANQLCNPPPEQMRTAGPNNYFRIAAPDPVQGRAMARFAANVLGVKRVAAFTMQGDFDDLTLNLFADELKRDGGELVYQANLHTQDFRGFLQNARTSGAEAIYAATESDVCQARAQMKGIFPADAYFLGMDNMQESDDCIKNAKDQAEGMLAAVSVFDPSDPAVKAEVGAYRRANPHGPAINAYTLSAYDCALILIQAITQAINKNGGAFPKRAQVVNVLAHSQFKGLVANYAFDANGDARSPLMALYQVKGGQWVYVRQIDASASS